MTATDELRHLLDEHDVDWSSEILANCLIVTMWTDNEMVYEFNELIDSNHAYLEMNINPCTPGEAIATWNSQAERTCKCTTDDSAWCFVCSECGKSFPRNKLYLAHNHGEINYCPNCGCKVVSA